MTVNEYNIQARLGHVIVTHPLNFYVWPIFCFVRVVLVSSNWLFLVTATIAQLNFLASRLNWNNSTDDPMENWLGNPRTSKVSTNREKKIIQESNILLSFITIKWVSEWVERPTNRTNEWVAKHVFERMAKSLDKHIYIRIHMCDMVRILAVVSSA